MYVLNNDRIMNLTDNGLNLNYQPYKYTDYNDSDMHNYFTNTFPDSKYYSGKVLVHRANPQHQGYILFT